MADSLRIVVYVFGGLGIIGFLAGFTDGMMGYTGIIGGWIMLIGIFGFGITYPISYFRNRKLKKESKIKTSTPI